VGRKRKLLVICINQENIEMKKQRNGGGKKKNKHKYADE
jgi:hypothetical protein